MSNVVSLNLPRRRLKADNQTALVECFANQRRTSDDVFWLKENAELLGILESTGAALPEAALAPLEGFYA